MDQKEYLQYLTFAYDAYQNHNVTGQEFRQKGLVPYANHPIWCATTLLHDTRLPWGVRELGFRVLLLHDVLEDTSVTLPVWVSPDVVHYVKEMTFSNFAETVMEAPNKEPFVKLLLLVDKLSTLLEEHLKPDPVKRKQWKDIVVYLTGEVEKVYGRTRIIQMAAAMAAATDW